jgi:hypothetical protein
MWNFTKHVCIRMEERGFSKGDVLQVLNGEVPTIIYTSPQDEFVDLFFGQVMDKFLMIPVNRKTKAIITIRPMRKKEKEIYLSEVQNG